jgi:hypothetical protein
VSGSSCEDYPCIFACERDNAQLLISNPIFLTTTATTFTGSDGMRRHQVDVSIGREHPPMHTMPLLMRAAEDAAEVFTKPAPAALLLDYGDSAIKYAVRLWIASPMKGTRISSNARLPSSTIYKPTGSNSPCRNSCFMESILPISLDQGLIQQPKC